MSPILRTLAIATLSCTPLIVLGSALFSWIMVWRHCFSQEHLKRIFEPNSNNEKESSRLPEQEAVGTDQQLKLDLDQDTEKVKKEVDLGTEPTVHKNLNDKRCLDCSSISDITLTCNHVLCRSCLLERPTQRSCYRCEKVITRGTRIGIWSYKATFTSAYLIIGIFLLKSLLCWSVLCADLTTFSSRLLCPLDTTSSSWERPLMPMWTLYSIYLLQAEHRTSKISGSKSALISRPDTRRILPILACQISAEVLRMTNDLGASINHAMQE